MAFAASIKGLARTKGRTGPASRNYKAITGSSTSNFVSFVVHCFSLSHCVSRNNSDVQYCSDSVRIPEYGEEMAHSPTLCSAVEDLFDTLSEVPSPVTCKRCGSGMLYLDSTFFSSGERVWTLPLPVCPKCDLKNDTAEFVSMLGAF